MSIHRCWYFSSYVFVIFMVPGWWGVIRISNSSFKPSYRIQYSVAYRLHMSSPSLTDRGQDSEYLISLNFLISCFISMWMCKVHTDRLAIFFHAIKYRSCHSENTNCTVRLIEDRKGRGIRLNVIIIVIYSSRWVFFFFLGK